MKKTTIVLLFCLLVGTVNAQDVSPEPVTINWADLVFDDARVSLAGPNALYLSNVTAMDKSISFLLRQNENGSWRVTETWEESGASVFPGQSFFDLANIQYEGTTLIFNGVYLEKTLKQVSFSVQDDGSLILDADFKAGSIVGRSLERSRDLGRVAWSAPLADGVTNGVDLTESTTDTDTSELLGQVGDLRSKNEALVIENQGLNDRIVALGNSNDDLLKTISEQNSSYERNLAEKDRAYEELLERNGILAEEVGLLKDELSNLATLYTSTSGRLANVTSPTDDSEAREAREALLAEVVSLKAQIGTLEAEIASLKEKIAEVPAPQETPPANSDELTRLQGVIADLTRQNEQLMAERQGIEQALRASFLTSGYINSTRSLFTKKVLDGFTNGRPEIGRWVLGAGLLRQTDPSQYYSRYVLPLEQKRETLLYRFTLRSTGTSWVGAGLHLFAANSPLRGYGHGKSLLIWFTKDPAVYREETTHLQLYKSDDDVAMGRVLDATISDAIDKDMVVEVLYQPLDEYITVSVNGVEKIRYKTWFDIDEGIEVALRTLDTAEFKNLEVLAQ